MKKVDGAGEGVRGGLQSPASRPDPDANPPGFVFPSLPVKMTPSTMGRSGGTLSPLLEGGGGRGGGAYIGRRGLALLPRGEGGEGIVGLLSFSGEGVCLLGGGGLLASFSFRGRRELSGGRLLASFSF